MGKWTFQPVFDSYLFVLVLATALVALLWMRPSFGNLTPKQRHALRLLRALTTLLLVVALLRPARIVSAPLAQPASLLVLFDTSRSMQLPDARDSRSRWEAQREALQKLEPVLARLGPKLDVRVYAYDHQIRPVPQQGNTWQWPDTPQGRETDIGSCLDDALRHELGRRVAAVILLGDGVQTASSPKVELYEASRQLARMGTPLFTVAFGRAGDTEESRDVAVENLPEQYTAFVQNEIRVRGILRVRGYANQTIPVELVVTDASGKEQIIGPKNIVPSDELRQVPVELSFVPKEAGQYKLTLRVAQQPGELVTSNNALTSFLTVLEGGLRVLYVYGSLVGEQRYLRWALESSPDISLRHLFIDPRRQEQWPDDRSELLHKEKSDVIILENVDSSAFRVEDLEMLAKNVENGVGFMMIGGYYSFGPGGYAEGPLRDVLPVEMSRLERQERSPTATPRSDVHWMPEEGIPMLPAAPHPVTRLAPEPDNESLWKKLPPLLGANRFQTVKPLARVLAASPTGEPLLVAGEYGRGRVLAFAGDSTRRWWQYGYQSEHKRFWRQVVLWLAHREDDQRSDVRITLPQRRYPPKAKIDVSLEVRSATGDPERDVQVSLTLHQPDGVRRDIQVHPKDGNFGSVISDLETPGDYQLQAVARRDGQTIGTAQLTFQILDQDVELSYAGADPDQLERLAKVTSDVGGRLVAAEELPALVENIYTRLPEDMIQIERRWRLGDTLFDAAILFLVLVGLLSVEWFLRKRWGLV